MTVENQKRIIKDRDSSKQEAGHHAKMLPSTAWLMKIFQAKNTTVGIVATCSRRAPDLEPSITAEIAYYTHGSLITQICQWKYLLRPTISKIAITHHHQLQLQEITWPNPELFRSLSVIEHDAPRCRHAGAVPVGRHIVMPPTPSSPARCRNLLCVFHVIVKLSGCKGLTWPSNVTGVDANDLRCPTTSTSSYGSENHTPPELIVGRACDAAPSRRSFFLSGSSFSSCAASAFGSSSSFLWAAHCRHAW